MIEKMGLQFRTKVMQRWFNTLILTSIVLFSNSNSRCYAYRIGDAVDTDVVYDGKKSDSLRSKMPLFGIHSATSYDMPEHSFTLQFVDGLWVLPTQPIMSRNQQYLDKIVVQFVYTSKSGTINDVSSKATYTPQHKPNFRVEYQWIPEPTLAWNAGFAILYLMVLIACSFFLLISCGIIANPSEDYNNNEQQQYSSIGGSSGINVPLSSSTSGYGQTISTPKWD